MAQLRLAPNTGNEKLIKVSEVVATDWKKTHTGLSDFNHITQRGLDVHDYALDEIWLEEDDGTLLFRGQLRKIDEQEGQDVDPTTTLEGVGPGHKLENSEVVYTVSNVLAHNAIDDFWTNETPFSSTTTTPSINNTVSGNVAQEANTGAEFGEIVDIQDTDPVASQNDNIELLQTSFTTEGEHSDFENDPTTTSNSVYSSGLAAAFNTVGQVREWDFTTQYDIPDFEVAIRWSTTTTSAVVDVEWYLDDTFISRYSPTDTTANDPDWQTGIIDRSNVNPELGTVEAGNHTLRAEVVDAPADSFTVDVVQPHDARFSYTYDNTLDGSGGYLDGPEFFPEAFDFAFNLYETPWNITDGTLTTTWDNTTNNQRIQIRLTDQTWFPNDGTENNTTSVTTDFGSEVGSAIQGRATFSRYGSTTNQTPKTGINGQKLQSWEILYDGNDRPVFSGENTFEGTELEVAQELHSRAGMRFTIEHEKDSLPVESYRPEDNVITLPTLDAISRTVTTDYENYANSITVAGQRVDGERLRHTEQDSTAISEDGQVDFYLNNPSLDSLNQIKVAARQLLIEKLREREDKGEMSVAPIDIEPGYGRDNPFNDDSNSTIPIEEVSYQIENGRLSGRLTFDFRTGARLAQDISGLRKGNREAKFGF